MPVLVAGAVREAVDAVAMIDAVPAPRDGDRGAAVDLPFEAVDAGAHERDVDRAGGRALLPVAVDTTVVVRDAGANGPMPAPQALGAAEAWAGAMTSARQKRSEEVCESEGSRPGYRQDASDLQRRRVNRSQERSTTAGSKSVPAPRAISSTAASTVQDSLYGRSWTSTSKTSARCTSRAGDRDRVACQAAGIAAAVPALVVVAGDRLGGLDERPSRRLRARARRARRAS